jgi:hypothetical protein
MGLRQTRLYVYFLRRVGMPAGLELARQPHVGEDRDRGGAGDDAVSERPCCGPPRRDFFRCPGARRT